MNRIEALQAAFNIAGPNVTAEEHIQYAEFLLGDENTTVLENRISKVDPREYVPNPYIGQHVLEELDTHYPVGTVALDSDSDLYYKDSDGRWYTFSSHRGHDWYPDITLESIAESYRAVIVA